MSARGLSLVAASAGYSSLWCEGFQGILQHPHILGHLENMETSGFPGGTVVKSLPASAGDLGSSPGPGRSHMPRSS